MVMLTGVVENNPSKMFLFRRLHRNQPLKLLSQWPSLVVKWFWEPLLSLEVRLGMARLLILKVCTVGLPGVRTRDATCVGTEGS